MPLPARALLVSHDGRSIAVSAADLAVLRWSASPSSLDDGTAVESGTAAAQALACASKGLWSLRCFLRDAASGGGYTVRKAVAVPAQRQPRPRSCRVPPSLVAGEGRNT